MRVLIVEDEIELRRLLVEEIEDLGYEAFEASSGAEGVQRVEEVQPHVICSDINMPEMNGHDFKAKLDAANLIDPTTTFVFISANATRTDIADGLMAGAEHYFTKPIDYDRFAIVLENIHSDLQK